MKTVVERLSKRGILCKKLTSITPKELGTRKQITLYIGVDIKGYYCSVMVLAKKSRVLSKEAKELMVLHEKMERYADTAITRRYIWVKGPLCSKAKILMEQAGWVFL
jgi:hypothetical protein